MTEIGASGNHLVQAVVFCELVRKEAGGKLLLIGVYDGNIVVDAFPAAINLTAHIEIRATAPAPFQASLHFADENGRRFCPPRHFALPPRGAANNTFSLGISAPVVFLKRCVCVLKASVDGAVIDLAAKNVVLVEEMAAEAERARLAEIIRAARQQIELRS